MMMYTFTRGLFVSAYGFVTSSGTNPNPNPEAVDDDDDVLTLAPN